MPTHMDNIAGPIIVDGYAYIVVRKNGKDYRIHMSNRGPNGSTWEETQVEQIAPGLNDGTVVTEGGSTPANSGCVFTRRSGSWYDFDRERIVYSTDEDLFTSNPSARIWDPTTQTPYTRTEALTRQGK